MMMTWLNSWNYAGCDGLAMWCGWVKMTLQRKCWCCNQEADDPEEDPN
jgi:hypothetical protein